MQLETFRGPDRASVLRRVTRSLGEDAMIVRSEVIDRGGRRMVEVIAARPEDLERFRRRLETVVPSSDKIRNRTGSDPYVVGVVGPSGSGKTSCALKLAMHPGAFGRRDVGLVSLDTYRVGGLEEIRTYSEIGDLPLEVVFHSTDMERARRGMRKQEVVVIDTPGRLGDGADWVEAFRELSADEVHLVLPASTRRDAAMACVDQFEALGLTHVLFTKLDEMGAERRVAELADAVELPALWVTDGPTIPGAIGPAGPRVLKSLGLRGHGAHRLTHLVV